MTQMTATPGLVVAYHASSEPDIPIFAPLSHFGSRPAALARARSVSKAGQAMTLYEVALELGVTQRIPDISPTSPRAATHSWLSLTDLLHYTVRPPILSATERDVIFLAAAPAARNALAGTEALVRTLAQHGIDSLEYVNRFEEPGSISWIVLRPSQVRVMDRSAI